MSIAKPELPWFQFSLRSLLILTLFVAVLCSIGVCTDWSVAVIIAAGAVSGRIVARRSVGLIVGILAGNVGACLAGGLVAIFSGSSISSSPAWLFRMKIAMIIGSLIGGLLGGSKARHRSK